MNSAMSRRRLLLTSTGLIAAGALAACQNGQTAQVIAQAALGYAANIANAVALAAQALQAQNNLPSAVPLDKILADAKDAQAAAASLQATMTDNAAQPIVQRIEKDLTEVANTVMVYLPAPYQGYLLDATIVLPLLLQAVGVASAAPAPVAQGAAQRLDAAPRAKPWS